MSQLEVGSKVIWVQDSELGYVVAVTSEAIEVDWALSGRQVYSVFSGAYLLIESVERRFACRFKR
jgi:hypothetical protein